MVRLFLTCLEIELLSILMVQKILLRAMQSVLNMVAEVELQEKAAEKAKEEASKAGLDTLSKVEELVQILTHAKEANDMVRLSFLLFFLLMMNINSWDII